MRRQIIAATIAAVAILGLAGCATTEPAPVVEETTIVEPAPATVAPTSEAAEPADASAAEEEFLASPIVEPLDLTEQEKLAAAQYACDGLASGDGSVIALEGVTVEYNRTFLMVASRAFCPELEVEVDPVG